MSWLDILIIVIIGISMVISVFRGLIKESISLATWVAAFWIAISFAGGLASILPDSLESTRFSIGDVKIAASNLRVGIAFMLLVIAVLILGAVINFVLSHLLVRGSLTSTDRLLGAGFGILRGAIIIVVFVIAAGLTSLPQSKTWRAAYLMPPFEQAALWSIGFLPDDIAKHFVFN